jgi:peptide-methionine (R)-S-oxide reductase
VRRWSRRQLLQLLPSSVAAPLAAAQLLTPQPARAAAKGADPDWALSDAEWRRRLSPEAYAVLRRQATERPFSSPLVAEKRAGIYMCAGCRLPLFSSAAKYESGTGWPSFWQPLPQALATRLDFRLLVPRTEYHCRRCGGHQGHVFKDGPRPSGERWCNNGVALLFQPGAAGAGPGPAEPGRPGR